MRNLRKSRNLIEDVNKEDIREESPNLPNDINENINQSQKNKIIQDSDIFHYPNSCKLVKKGKRDFPDSISNNFLNCDDILFYSPKLSSKEFTIDSFLKPRKRLPNLQAIRNGLLIISPGDKIYKSVEYQKDYFKQKIHDNKEFKKNIYNFKIDFYSGMDINKQKLNEDKLWENRRFREIIERDNYYLKNLDLWEEKYLNIKLPINKNTK